VAWTRCTSTSPTCPAASAKAGGCWRGLIQKAIFDATGLTCSVGVAPNKLLAKMASEFNKPNGISILHEAEMQNKSGRWPAAKSTASAPRRMKSSKNTASTPSASWPQDLQWLIDHFGQKTGAWLFDAAHGRDERAIVLESEPVSVSRETSFERDLHAVRDKAELTRIFTGLCEQVAADLQRKGYVGKTIGIKLRYADFKSVTRDQTLDSYTADPKRIRHTAGQCLKRVPLEQRLRLLGVRVGNLAKAGNPESYIRNMAFAQIERARAATNLIASDVREGQLF
jgi:DNA polymerase-4